MFCSERRSFNSALSIFHSALRRWTLSGLAHQPHRGRAAWHLRTRMRWPCRSCRSDSSQSVRSVGELDLKRIRSHSATRAMRRNVICFVPSGAASTQLNRYSIQHVADGRSLVLEPPTRSPTGKGVASFCFVDSELARCLMGVKKLLRKLLSMSTLLSTAASSHYHRHWHRSAMPFQIKCGVHSVGLQCCANSANEQR